MCKILLTITAFVRQTVNQANLTEWVYVPAVMKSQYSKLMSRTSFKLETSQFFRAKLRRFNVVTVSISGCQKHRTKVRSIYRFSSFMMNEVLENFLFIYLPKHDFQSITDHHKNLIMRFQLISFQKTKNGSNELILVD